MHEGETSLAGLDETETSEKSTISNVRGPSESGQTEERTRI